MSWRFLIVAALMTVSACGPRELAESELGIVGGRALATGEASPAIGLMLRFKEPSTVGYISRNCTGVRVSQNQILTAASCFGSSQSRDYQLAILVAGDGTKAQGLEVIDVSLHPDYSDSEDTQNPSNLAVITLAEFPAVLQNLVTKASLNRSNVSEGQAVQIYGAGCEKLKANGSCDGAPTILRYLKTFSTSISRFVPDPILKKFMTVDEANGSSVEGDIGGPVLKNGTTEILGIAAYRTENLGTFSTSYVNVARPEILSFLDRIITQETTFQEISFRIDPVASITGRFYPTGSFLTLEDFSTITDEGFSYSFSLNGQKLLPQDVTRAGRRFTLNRALQEGLNEVEVFLSDAESTLLFNNHIEVMAGSRSIRVNLPPEMQGAGRSLSSLISVKDGTQHRGLGVAEGNDIVFRNVPRLSTIVSIDSLLSGQSIREFVAPTVNSLQAELTTPPLSDASNLDWQRGLEGWTVRGDTSAATVMSGLQMKTRPIISVSSTASSHRRRLQSIQSPPAIPVPNYTIIDDVNYLLLSAQPNREVEVRKKFRPMAGNPVLVLRTLFRLRGADFLDAADSASVGAFTVQIINSNGTITERTSELSFDNTSPERYATAFFDIPQVLQPQLNGTLPEIEVRAKLKVYSHILGVPELVVAPVLLSDRYVTDMEFDDGNSNLSTIKVKQKNAGKKFYNLKTSVSKLEMLSMGSCKSKCMRAQELKNDLVVWGRLRLYGKPGTRITGMNLEILDSGGLIGEGPLYSNDAKAALLTTIPAEGSIRTLVRSPLFKYSTAILPTSLNPQSRVRIGVKITFSDSKEIHAPYNQALRVLQWYPGTKIVDNFADELSVGGDKWTFNKVGELIEPLMNTFVANDFSNLHGGPFAPHASHMFGNDVDLIHKAGFNDHTTIEDLVKGLDDPNFLGKIETIGVTLTAITDWGTNTVKYQNTLDVIDKMIDLADKKTSDGRYISPARLKDGDYVFDRRAIFQNWEGHVDHVHLRFKL